MRKYLNKKKIAGLLAFSLLFSSVPAWAAEDIPAASTETTAPSFYDLNFDADSCTLLGLFAGLRRLADNGTFGDFLA